MNVFELIGEYSERSRWFSAEKERENMNNEEGRPVVLRHSFLHRAVIKYQIEEKRWEECASEGDFVSERDRLVSTANASLPCLIGWAGSRRGRRKRRRRGRKSRRKRKRRERALTRLLWSHRHGKRCASQKHRPNRHCWCWLRIGRTSSGEAAGNVLRFGEEEFGRKREDTLRYVLSLIYFRKGLIPESKKNLDG